VNTATASRTPVPVMDVAKTALLVTDRFCVSHGKTTVVHGLSLRISEGEVYAIIGSNGAGKSSLLNGLLGLVSHSGEVHFAGKRIDALPTRALIHAGVSLSPEGRHVFPHLTVEENLDLGDLGVDMQSRDARRESLYQLFPRLKERRGQQAGTMSGGEQQMLAISRAMMASPKLIMLDEPTLGLAPIVVQEISRFIRTISASGVSVLLAEQNAEMALEVADRACVLQNGHLQMEGAARDIARDPHVRSAYLGL
jgi:branched-chain amino acid transport system ATP-binding protein